MDNLHERYKGLSLDDLLQDTAFIRSVVEPGPDSLDFHQRLLDEGIIDVGDFEKAVFLITSLQTQAEPVGKDELQTLWEDIEISNNNNLRKRRRRVGFTLSILSGISALWLAFVYLSRPEMPLPETLGRIENVEAPPIQGEDIQLVLAGNETLSLEGKEADIAYNEEGLAINNEDIEWRNHTATQTETVYNQLIVPLGKRSMLTLSEGTKIWVNAGTRVVYPVAFAGDKREIFVDGEVFLEVQRKVDQPFIVKTHSLSVKVLGTSFNVMAYAIDSIHSVVLVNGEVAVSASEKDETHLKPNEMYAYCKGTAEISTVDVNDYILWKSGTYKYKSESLGVILKRLSRYYGREIHYTDDVAGIRCSGSLEFTDDLDAVLDGISLTAPITLAKEKDTYSIKRK